jgi:hypothetical protein
LEIWEHSWINPLDESFSIFSFVIKVHSVLLFGEDLSKKLPDFRLSPEIARDDLLQIGPDIFEAREAIRLDSSKDNVRYWATRISKNIIRSCFGLEMIDIGKFTRDLELCAHSFLSKHPERRKDMTFWLSQLEDPIEDAEELSDALEEVSAWLTPAAKRWLELNPNIVSSR